MADSDEKRTDEKRSDEKRTDGQPRKKDARRKDRTRRATRRPSVRAAAGLPPSHAGRWVLVAMVTTAGIYFLRFSVEGAANVTGQSKFRQLIGAGTVPEPEVWLISYGIVFMVLAVMATASPELASAFAILIMVVNLLENGVQLTRDLGFAQSSINLVTAPPPSGNIAAAVAAARNATAVQSLEHPKQPAGAYGVAVPAPQHNQAYNTLFGPLPGGSF